MAWMTYNEKKTKPYLVRWRDGDRRREKGFESEAEAKLFHAERTIADAKNGKRPRRPRDFEIPTFKTVGGSFLIVKEHPRRGDPVDAVTLRGYRSYLESWVYPVVGDVLVNRISAEHFEKVYDTANLAGAARKTKKEALRVMGAVLKHAKASRYIPEVPTHDIDTSPTRKESIREKAERREKSYTPDEVYSMLAAADTLANDDNQQIRNVWQRYRAMTYFLVFTGTRIGEVRAFPRRDYDPTRGSIHITQAAPDSGPVGHVKTADGVRDIPLHPKLREVMDGYLKQHKRTLAFGTASDLPLNHGNVHRRLLEPLKVRADALASQGTDPRFVKVSRNRAFHAFRHHYASRLVENGADLLTLKTYMGHASAAFTLDCYGHLFQGQNDQVVTGLVI